MAVMRRPAVPRAWAITVLIAAGMGLAVPFSSRAAAQAPRVDDFGLLDHRGRFHELYYHRDAAAVVIFVQGNGCPIARNAVPVLNAMSAEYTGQGVVFLGLNANPQDRRDAVAAEVDEFGLQVPVLLDATQLVAEALGVERTAEVFVIDPDGWRLLYHGPLDDRLHYDGQKPAKHDWVGDVLDAHLEGREVAYERRDSPGCLVSFPDRPRAASPPPSYAADVAPVLMRHCRSCHRPAGVAPWSMSDFAMVRGWSAMMREVVRTRRMPPWDADPHVGRFANDISLSDEEARTLVHWIEAGAPRGEGADPLAETPPPSPPDWALGVPDLVVEGPQQSVPATGVVDYRYETVEVPIERDRWLRAVDLRPTNSRVTHHATAYIVLPEGAEEPEVEGPRFVEGLFAGYVPGRAAEPFPEGTGFVLPAGARIRFQLHYSTTGKPEQDTPRIGLYFADGPQRHALKIGAAVNYRFEVPAGAEDHEDVAERVLGRDIIVHRLTPHMHFRGRRMAIEAHHADGSREVLLNVPRYRFNWQRQYVLAEPRRLLRGTRIVARAGFDNSTKNPANPDPERPVGWGEQSFDEMLIGYFMYHDAEPGPDPALAQGH